MVGWKTCKHFNVLGTRYLFHKINYLIFIVDISI
jgi:hypothetical protein